MSLLNPEFSQKIFIPDSTKSYRCNEDISSTGFMYIHALVLGGKSRIDELREYSQLDTFREECDKKLDNGYTALSLVLLSKEKYTLQILFPFYNTREIRKCLTLITQNFDIIPKTILSASMITKIVAIQEEIIEEQKKTIEEQKHRLSDRETFKDAIFELGMTAENATVLTYL